jgi:hypothetical protein
VFIASIDSGSRLYQRPVSLSFNYSTGRKTGMSDRDVAQMDYGIESSIILFGASTGHGTVTASNSKPMRYRVGGVVLFAPAVPGEKIKAH